MHTDDNKIVIVKKDKNLIFLNEKVDKQRRRKYKAHTLDYVILF